MYSKIHYFTDSVGFIQSTVIFLLMKSFTLFQKFLIDVKEEVLDKSILCQISITSNSQNPPLSILVLFEGFNFQFVMSFQELEKKFFFSSLSFIFSFSIWKVLAPLFFLSVYYKLQHDRIPTFLFYQHQRCISSSLEVILVNLSHFLGRVIKTQS